MIRLSVVFLVLASLLSPVSLLAGERLPAEVRQFIEQRESCDHFRGEVPDPSSKQRMKEVNREIRKLCTGTDKKLARLKQKYSGSSKVIARLTEFKSRIEAESTDKTRPAK
jgi:hypothetical protein